MNPDNNNDDIQVVTSDEADEEFGTMPSLSVYAAQNAAAFAEHLTDLTLAVGRGTPDLITQCTAAYTHELVRYWTERADQDNPKFYEFTEG